MVRTSLTWLVRAASILLFLHPPALALDVPTVPYPTLQSAYDAVSVGPTTIQLSSQNAVLANSIPDTFLANSAVEVTLLGGFNQQFQQRSGTTVVAGRMVINSGKVVADGIALREEYHNVGIQITSAFPGTYIFEIESLSLPAFASMDMPSGVKESFPPKLIGTPYTIVQLFGPTACLFSPNYLGIVGFTDISITANCGNPALSISSFSASPTLITSGESSLLTPVFTGGTGTISPGIGAVTSGLSYQVTPTISTSYALTVSDSFGGTVSRNLVVAVKKPFELVSISNTSSPASFQSYLSRAMVTPDGRYVVFASADDTLVPGETKGLSDIYLRDRLNGTTERISSAPDGSQANSSSDKPKISDDGCRVIYESTASNLVAGGPHGSFVDIYLTDRCTIPWTTTRISVDSAGNTGNGSSLNPDMSADGRYVVFASDAILTAEIPNSTAIYLRDTLFDTTSLVSRKANGSWGLGTNPVISADGATVIYESWNDNLGQGTTVWQLYAYDITSGATTLVSSDASGTPRSSKTPESSSRAVRASLSNDGRYVSFSTATGNLVPGITNGIQNTFQNVFVKDTQSGAISLVSQNVAGVSGNGDSVISQGGRAALSGTGEWISYNTKATNLIGGQNSTMVASTVTGQTEIIHPGSSQIGDTDPFLSQDPYGRFILIKAGENLDPRFVSRGIFFRDRHNAPVAVAGPSQTVPLGSTVILNGAGSSAASNVFPVPQQPLTYTWTQIEGPSVSFSNPHKAITTFIATVAGNYRFQLIVNDSVENSAPDTTQVNVQ